MSRFTKQIKNSVVALLCVAATTGAVFGAAACTVDSPEKEPVTPPEIVNPDTPVKPDPDTPDIPIEDENKEKFETTVAGANKFVASVQKENFTYQTEDATVLVNSSKLKVNDVFYELGEEGEQYQYALSKSDNKYHKTVYDAEKNWNYFDEVDNMLEQLTDIEWKAENNGVLTGTLADKDISYKSSTSTHTLTIDGKTSKYYDINSTTVKSPTDFVDETVKAPVESENLFDEQGNMRCGFVAEILEDWMDETNYYSKMNYGGDCSVKKIAYVDSNGTDLKFGALVDVAGQKGFQGFKAKASLMTQLTNGTIKTKTDLLKYLNDTKNPVTLDSSRVYTDIDYSNYDEDYAENKAILDGLTESVFEKLSTEISGLNPDNVLFAYKTPRGTDSPGAEFGNITAYNLMYIILVDGKVQLLNVGLSASTNYGSGNEVQNVIDNTKYWYIRSHTLTELDNSNKEIYETKDVATKQNEIIK